MKYVFIVDRVEGLSSNAVILVFVGFFVGVVCGVFFCCFCFV